MKHRRILFECRYGCGYKTTDPRPRGKHEHDKHGKVWTDAEASIPPLPVKPALPAPTAEFRPAPPNFPPIPRDSPNPKPEPMDLLKAALGQLERRKEKLTLDLQIMDVMKADLDTTNQRIKILSEAIRTMNANPVPAPAPESI